MYCVNLFSSASILLHHPGKVELFYLQHSRCPFLFGVPFFLIRRDIEPVVKIHKFSFRRLLLSDTNQRMQ